ncbi:MAG: hypothetical protein HDS84_08875 [Bacteroidales bacterium]|nr:hypothetical protein [Bacteroidales bacterium]
MSPPHGTPSPYIADVSTQTWHAMSLHLPSITPRVTMKRPLKVRLITFRGRFKRYVP